MHETHPTVDRCEVLLHELAHMRLLNLHPDEELWGVIDTCLKRRPPLFQALHEVRAIAIELEVAKRLGLGLNYFGVLWTGARNTPLIWDKCLHSEARFRKLYRRARRTQKVQRLATQLVQEITSTGRINLPPTRWSSGHQG